MSKILSINASSTIRGGADRFFFELNRLLIEKRNEVITFTTQSDKNDATKYTSRSYYTKKYDLKGSLIAKLYNLIRIFFAPSIIRDLERVIKIEKPEIAHIHNIYHRFPYSIVKTLKKHKIKIIWWLHDYKWICPNHQLYTNNHLCTLCTDNRYWRAIRLKCQKGSLFESLVVTIFSYYTNLMRYSHLVDLFIAPSTFAHSIQKQHFNNSTVLHHFNYNRDDNKDLKFQSINEQPFALYVGRIEQNKGIDTLVQSFMRTNFNLKIVGDGNYLKEIEDYCTQKEIKNISFEGFKCTHDLIPFYNDCLFTIVPSQWYEVFGLSILESFSFGKPVLASKIGAIPEIIEDGKSGLLFEPFNTEDLITKANYLFNHQEITNNMGIYAYQKSLKSFSRDDYYTKLDLIQKQI